jgi:hypothetical protein
MVEVEARTSDGSKLAYGAASAAVERGERRDVTVVLDRSPGVKGNFVPAAASAQQSGVSLTGQLSWHALIRGSAGDIRLEGWIH